MNTDELSKCFQSFNNDGDIKVFQAIGKEFRVTEYTKKAWDSICNRCGFCCRQYDSKTGHWKGKYCPHLHFDSDHKAVCDIFPNCYGTITNKTNICVPVEYVDKRAVGSKCPYNAFLGRKDITIYRFNGKAHITYMKV